MIKFSIDVQEIAHAAQLMKDFPEVIKPELLKANRNSSAILLQGIYNNMQSWRKTGTLMRSWKVLPTTETEEGFTGGAAAGGIPGKDGRKYSYAAVWEFGFHGTVNVRAHQRVYRSGTVGQVRSHERTMNVTARPYVRPALETSRQAIGGFHMDAVKRAWARVGGA
jgi:hypothetical protein